MIFHSCLFLAAKIKVSRTIWVLYYKTLRISFLTEKEKNQKRFHKTIRKKQLRRNFHPCLGTFFRNLRRNIYQKFCPNTENETFLFQLRCFCSFNLLGSLFIMLANFIFANYFDSLVVFEKDELASRQNTRWRQFDQSTRPIS